MKSIFEKFGGIRAMAKKLGLPPSTVKSWHAKRSIPDWRHDRVMKAAADHKIPLKLDEIVRIRPDSEPLKRGAPKVEQQARAA